MTSPDNMFELSPDQYKFVNDYIRAVYNTNDRSLYFHIIRKVRELIERYGETGYGNKPETMDTVEYWLSHLHPYTNIMSKPDDTFDWKDKVVCFSGRIFRMTKSKAEALVSEAGGTITKTVTKNTTHLVFCGNFNTNKVKRAIDHGTPMMFATDFKDWFLSRGKLN